MIFLADWHVSVALAKLPGPLCWPPAPPLPARPRRPPPPPPRLCRPLPAPGVGHGGSQKCAVTTQLGPRTDISDLGQSTKHKMGGVWGKEELGGLGFFGGGIGWGGGFCSGFVLVGCGLFTSTNLGLCCSRNNSFKWIVVILPQTAFNI